MATFTVKSTEITNLLAAPPVQTNGYIAGGIFKEKVATVEVLAAQTTGATYALFSLPSNARISSLEVVNDAITTTGSFDIGVYTADRDGNITAVDVDNFGSAVSMVTARSVWLDVLNEQDATDIDKIEKRIYERDGIALTADPKVTYIVALTATDDTATDGTVTMRVRYVV